MRNTIFSLLAVLSVGFLSGCAPSDNPIQYGKDICANCSMVIMDSKFGAEAVNKNGKAFKFDSIECLLKYLKENPGSGADKYLVAEFETAGALRPAEKMIFVQNEAFKSPMGGNLAAFKDTACAGKYGQGGKIFQNFSELLKVF